MTKEYFLETARLKACLPKMDFLDDYVAMFADKEFIACYGVAYDREQVQQRSLADIEHWEKYGFGMWMWCDKVSGNYVGRAGLKRIEIAGVDEVELGYAIKKEYWGQGLAKEMARAAIEYGFNNLQLRDLVCFTLASNVQSLSVMKKLGFIYEKDFIYANLPHKLHRLKA
jgi:ribosomal-protein-alanine N-acetyltransferase